MAKNGSIITQIELSRLAGVSKQCVYKAIKAGHIKVNKSRKVVFDDRLTQLWLEGQLSKKDTQSTTTVVSQTQEKKQRVTPKSNKPLAEIKIEEEIRKIKADRRLKELKYRKDREDLIDKEKVAGVLFKYLDALNSNMLDVPDMVIDTLVDKIKAGSSRGDLIKLMRDRIQKEIVSTKGQITERLK
jgi:hypothetical protein